MMQQLSHNPLAWKLGLLTFLSVCAFITAVALIRRLRRNLQSEAEPLAQKQSNAGLALSTYDGLARQIREQQEELQQVQQRYQEETALAARISEALLANLSCGVLYFDRVGVVRQANRTAKSLLGYASPISFHMRDLFRGVIKTRWPESGEQTQSPVALLRAFQETLAGAKPFPRSIMEYRTPSGQKRSLGMNACAVRNKAGDVVGLSCVIDDLTEITELSERVHRNENFASLGEISAGLANDFKKSLATVVGYAELLLKEDSDPTTRFYAERVISELDSLSRILDEFLEFASSTKN
ncbi:MAG TPA: histidine kinase dimerization/phospho-acceptor domain-containing protein [Candidatus Angelobacter sp.]